MSERWSDDETASQSRLRRSYRNNFTELYPHFRLGHAPSLTVQHQLFVSKNNSSRYLSTQRGSGTWQHLVPFSAHDYPPFLSSFTVLGYAPCNL